MNRFNKLALLATASLLMAPSFANAAVAKKKTTSTTTQTTSTDSGTSLMSGNSAVGFNRDLIKGLSVFGAYDFADSIKIDSDNYNYDGGMILGAQYQTKQFAPGFSAQGGFEYEFARTISKVNADLSSWRPFAELVAQVVPQLSVMGGMNYGFPSITKLKGDIKGKVGFQFGGSYAFNKNIALDGRYRIINYKFSPDHGDDVDLKESGFMLDGRYMF